MKIAFYKAPGNLFDKVIRWWTKSKYSHCELVFSDGLFFSADPRDNGVRYKNIYLDTAKWDLVDAPMDLFDENRVRHWCDSKIGKGYDWTGIALSQVFPFSLDSPGKYFCSEICVAALQQVGRIPGIEGCEVSPQGLYILTA